MNLPVYNRTIFFKLLYWSKFYENFTQKSVMVMWRKYHVMMVYFLSQQQRGMGMIRSAREQLYVTNNKYIKKLKRNLWLGKKKPDVYSKGPVYLLANLRHLSFLLIDWLIVWYFMQFSTEFPFCRGGQCSNPCFLGVLLTNTTHSSQATDCFRHNHCRNNWLRWDRKESCRNDYHQSSEGILAKPGIEPATSCSQVL